MRRAALKSPPLSLKRKFVLVSSLIMMFVLIFEMIYFISIQNTTRQMIKRYTDDMVTQAINSIEVVLKGIRQTAIRFSYGMLVDRLMEPQNDYALYTIWNFQDSMVRAVAETNRDIYDVVLCRTDGHVRYQHNFYNMRVRELLDKYESSILFPDGPQGFFCFTDDSGATKIPGYIQRILHTATKARYGSITGACVVMLNPDILSRIVQEIPTIGNSEFLLLDQNDFLISGSRTNITDISAYLSLPGVVRREVGDTGWFLAARMDTNVFYKNYRFSRSFSLVVAISILLLLILQINIFNRNIVAPVSRLHEKINDVIASRFSDRITMPEGGEIGGIAQAINIMLDHHGKMAEQILQTRQSLWEARLESKQNEVTALESQINPHFLMNTLQCICGIAVENSVPLIVDLVSCLRDIFDYSLHGREDATLRDEVNCLRYYLSIIDIRFDYAFSWYIDIPEELLDQLIGKMILQPLAENAIYHGLEKKGSGCLRISARREGEQVTVFVEDDGQGIPEDRLGKLQVMLMDRERIRRESIDHKKIGIANTCRRIKMMFGDEYGIDIQSAAGRGTSVAIHIPLSRGEA